MSEVEETVVNPTLHSNPESRVDDEKGEDKEVPLVEVTADNVDDGKDIASSLKEPPGTSHTKRTIKLTAKGLQYNTENSKKEFSRKLKSTKTSLRNLTRVTITSRDPETIRKASALMYKALDDLSECLNSLGALIGREQIHEFETKFEELENSAALAADGARIALQQQIAMVDREEVASARYSKSKRGSVSGGGSMSKGSSDGGSFSSIQEDRIKKLERVAELKARLPYVEAESKLRQQMERLKMEEEIAGLEAGAGASKKAELEEFGHGSGEELSSLPLESNEEKQERILRSFENSSSVVRLESPKKEKIQAAKIKPKVANCASSFSSTYRIPRIKIEPFDGSIVEFPAWEIAFNALVDDQVESTDVKLNLLSQHLVGEAKQLVIGLLSQQTESCYHAARKRLKERYGNPNILSQAFLNKIEEWPVIKPHHPKELQQFSDLLVQIAEIRKSVGGLQILDFPQESKKILAKLPKYFENDWRDEICSWREEKDADSYPPFDHLVRFVERRSNKANIPELQSLKTMNTGRSPHRERQAGNNARALKTSSSAERGNCSYCSLQHHINDCSEFPKLSRDDCLKFLKDNQLCFGCGSSADHFSRKCEARAKCQTCGKLHLTALHLDEQESKDVVARCTEVCSVKDQGSGSDNSMIVPVYVRPKDEPNKEILCYCILDDQSNTCFMSNKLRHQLGLTGCDTVLTLSTMQKSQCQISSKKVTNLELLSLDRQVRIDLPATYTRDHIPASRSQIPKPEVAEKWDHLREIAKKMSPYHAKADIALLVGNNVPRAVRPREIVTGSDDQPYGQRSILGWGIVGIVCQSAEARTAVSNRINVSCVVSNPVVGVPLKPGDARFVCATKAKEIINPNQVRQMMELDFTEPNNANRELSIDDMKFVQILSNNIKQLSDGHYSMPLPMRSEQVALTNNRPLAVKRIMQLKRRLAKNVQFRQDYVEFMSDVIEKWAEEVPLEEMDRNDGKVNYVPHTGVYHAKKNKIRVVFDCSAEYEGVSLNDHLLRGPNLLNGMLGVFCRFRKENVALMADIQAMFHQFYVSENDRDYLRFLWWENGDIYRPLRDYRMKVHLFGASSSPGCANFGLKRAADDGEEEFGTPAAEFVRNDFYVDDGLISLPSEEKMLCLIESSRAICAKGGLRLHKFLSNNEEVMKAIPESERAKSWKPVVGVSECPNALSVERALGVIWCVENDSFQFRIELKDSPLSRRGILSTVSSIFDPTGFVAPVVLVAKKILQDLCRSGASWDDPISDELSSRWSRWRSEIPALERLEVKRCFKPPDFNKLAKVELHHFSDACETGLGQCSYLKFVNEDGRVHCAFVMGKARVAPLKHVTVPRMELTAAVISAKVGKFLKDELKYSSISEYFWVDSKIVLGYVNNEAKRFNVFVANRVQQIRDLSEPSRWLYVKSNPSDVASRGMEAKQLFSKSLWLSGPNFLWSNVESYSENRYQADGEIDSEIKKEMRKATAFATTASKNSGFESSRLIQFSSWNRARRAVATCILYKRKLYARVRSKGKTASINQVESCPNKVSVHEFRMAEVTILRGVQLENFSEEITYLRDRRDEIRDDGKNSSKYKVLRVNSSLHRLDPFLDNDGLLKVGGRIRRANLSDSLKHPIIIPKGCHIAKLLINHYHQEVNHMGRGTTHNHLRQNGYWIIGGSSAVSQVLSKCVLCKRMRGIPQVQKMSELPEDRLAEEPPFTYSAVDFFGPFNIKERRSVLKRYGVLFTCMSSRAVHLECANTLETDSFINALRRFLSRRGPVAQLRSDCGTNIVGANNELKRALKEMDDARVHEYLLHNNCDWVEFKFNVPHSSHMGGVWERQIRTVRNALEPLLLASASHLDDESFRTFLTEVENIINSRPLTTENLCDPDSPEPLTPNHLLTMKHKLLLPPPGRFVKADQYARKRWRRVQYLANEFWQRWRKECLHQLQTRKKWTQVTRNMRPKDVVIVRDDDLPRRNLWRLAVVENTYPSSDGLVRKVRLRMADSSIDAKGKRMKSVTYLDRPVHKLVLLHAAEGEDDAQPVAD